MAGLGTRAGTCSHFVASESGNCRVCGRPNYQHDTVSLDSFTSASPDQKKLYVTSLVPDQGETQGGEKLYIIGRNFLASSHSKGHMWAKFGNYKVPVLYESSTKLTCTSPYVPFELLDSNEFSRTPKPSLSSKTKKNSAGPPTYEFALEVRLTVDNGVTWSNKQLYRLKIDGDNEGNKYNYSSCYYWGGLPRVEKRKPKKGEVYALYDKFLDVRKRMHPHQKYCLQHAMGILALMLYYSSRGLVPKFGFEEINSAFEVVTRSYPYTFDKRRDKMEKYGLFKDVLVMLLEATPIDDNDASKNAGGDSKSVKDETVDDGALGGAPINKTVALVIDWLGSSFFSEFLAILLDRLSWMEQSVREIAITRTVAGPHAVILMENGLLEIQSFSQPSDFSSAFVDGHPFLNEKEVEAEGWRYCRQWHLDDDMKQLPIPTLENISHGESTEITYFDVIERLKKYFPELNFCCDPSIISVSKTNEKLGWLFSSVPGLVSQKIKFSKIACGMAHFCAVSDVVFGHRLYTWGENGAGQLGRPTTSQNANIPGIVDFKTEHGSNSIDKRVDVMRVGVVNCGELYTICACTSDATGLTHIFSFGQPNSPNLEKCHRGLPHKVVGVDLPSEVLIVDIPTDIANDRKAASGQESRVWKAGEPMTIAGKCMPFFPLSVKTWYNLVWDQWSFFRRRNIKTFKFGNIYEHRKPAVLGRATIPIHFSYERSQYDEIHQLYFEAIEEVDVLIDLTNATCDDYRNNYNIGDSEQLAPADEDMINVQNIVEADLRDGGGYTMWESGESEDDSYDSDDSVVMKLNFGSEKSSRFVGLYTPGKDVKISPDPSWFELQDEIQRLQNLLKTQNDAISEEEMLHAEDLNQQDVLSKAMKAIGQIHLSAANRMTDGDEKVARGREEISDTSMVKNVQAVQLATRKMSFFSKQDFQSSLLQTKAVKNIVNMAEGNDNPDALKPARSSSSGSPKSQLSSSASFLRSPLKKRSSMMSHLSEEQEKLSSFDFVNALKHFSVEKLGNLKSRLLADSRELSRNVKERVRNIRKMKEEKKETDLYLQTHFELQKDWILVEILEHAKSFPSDEMMQFRQAYRSGRSDFEEALSNAEVQWQLLCERMPNQLIDIFNKNLTSLKEIREGNSDKPIRDVLRNLPDIFVDEGSNLGLGDFINFSDMELVGVVERLTEMALHDIYLSRDEGLKLVKIIQENAELRLRTNLLHQLRQNRLHYLQTGTLQASHQDPDTVLHKYYLFSADNTLIQEEEEGTGDVISSSESEEDGEE